MHPSPTAVAPLPVMATDTDVKHTVSANAINTCTINVLVSNPLSETDILYLNFKDSPKQAGKRIIGNKEPTETTAVYFANNSVRL